MFLMNKDTPVLWYQMDQDDTSIKILDNDMLPYSLKGYLHDTGTQSSGRTYSEISAFRDYLASRTLSLSRDNAKAILNSAALPQSLRTEEKISIVEVCRGLSIDDSFWLRKDNEELSFDSVNLRHIHLKDAAFAVSIGGDTLSVQKEILMPDISTHGMFAKTWYRSENGIELWKTDRTTDNINTRCEAEASEILGKLGVDHVNYEIFERDGRLIVKCKSIADDSTSLISAQEIKDWFDHTGQDFNEWLKDTYPVQFANMCVSDYLIANPDRHIENRGFLVDVGTNRITDVAPLFDHNQALVSDYAGKDISDIIYDPTGKTLKESAIEAYGECRINETAELPEKVRARLDIVLKDA